MKNFLFEVRWLGSFNKSYKDITKARDKSDATRKAKSMGAKHYGCTPDEIIVESVRKV